MSTATNLRALARYINTSPYTLDMRDYVRLRNGPTFISPRDTAGREEAIASLCAIGHAALAWPAEAAASDSWSALYTTLFPDLGTGRWFDVFGADLSSNRRTCVRRLYRAAREVAA